jgi:serpin B
MHLRASIFRFAAKVFAKLVTEGDDNLLISPYSIYVALLAAARGSAGESLEAFKTLLFENESLDETIDALRMVPKSGALKVANSVWYREGVKVHEDYLAALTKDFNSVVEGLDFKDPEAIDRINAWVSKKTEGMIESIIRKLHPNAIMVLINALCFEAQWEEVYQEKDVYDSFFENINGESVEVEFMSSKERSLIVSDTIIGFKKPYLSRRYSFIALLGEDFETLVESLDSLEELIDSAEDAPVNVILPKFSYEFESDLSETLKQLGLENLFNPMADFSRMCEDDAYIGQVNHKTFIEVAEQGTKAGAATSVMMLTRSAFMKIREVILNRPFIYLIYDEEAQIPIFMGAVKKLPSIK